MAHTTANTTLLTRQEIWSNELKELLRDELMAMQYVNWMTDFPDGNTFTIPSIGTGDVDDYQEDEDIVYRPLDTGEFQFTITEYLSSGNYITEKAMQDMFYANQLMSRFVPEQERALMVRLEGDILKLAPDGQTAADTNDINGEKHRYVATGTSNVMSVEDFARARLSLKKANVPDTNLIAIVDPSVEYTLNTSTNLVNISNNPMWEGIVSDGIASGMRFVKNVYGFDVWSSNHLKVNAAETLETVAISGFANNLFFSAAPGISPFVGAWRQMPKVDSEFDMDKQRTKFATTARYGLAFFRPENMVVVPSQTSV
jgi:hypothetical protein